MVNFNYYTSTDVVFGKDTEKKSGELCRQFKAKKVLIHYGGESAVKSGLLDRVKSSLNAAGVEFCELGGVKPNPRLSLVYEGIKFSKKNNVDFILAVGGGSVIDSAKAIAFGMTNDYDVWDLYCGKSKATECIPLGVILTLAAAGSETSSSTVITNEETGEKRGYTDNLCRPKFAILNPELTMTLPSYQTNCGIVDIMMHTMERYFSAEDTMEVTDAIAEGILRTVIHNARILKNDPDNYNARAEIMWCGSLSHDGLTGCGGIGDWATHNIEHQLSAIFDVAHGAGLSALWGSWARCVYRENVSRFAKFADKIFDISCDDDEIAALSGIEAMENLYSEIGMPVSIKELGVNYNDEQIEASANFLTNDGKETLGRFKKLTKENIIGIYKSAR